MHWIKPLNKSPKAQKEHYHNKIREWEKRTGKSLNVKGVSKNMFYDNDINESIFNYSAALDMLNENNIYIYHDYLVEEDILSNGTNWLKYGFAKKDGKVYKYYYEIKKWGKETEELDNPYHKTKVWKAAMLMTKFIGSNFDDFAKENNIILKRDINWALKMIKAGKIMTRENNPKIYLFPPDKYDNSHTKITVEDLFAEDWQIFHLKTFRDVLDDFYKGKSIRRKSWPDEWEIGEYSNSVLIRYADMLADDWEVVDVVAEVNSQQEQILKDRNEH